MSDLKVHMMHAEVSAALERLSKLFKPGMKISFIARLPGNGEADVLIGDDHDADELIALVRRRFGSSTVSAPEEVQEQLVKALRGFVAYAEACDDDSHEIDRAREALAAFDALRTTSGKGEAA